MKKFTVDVVTRQFSKKGEDICGDAVRVLRTPDSTIIAISDGLGSGVKANVLATLTVEIAGGLFRGDLSLHEIVETLVATLPICKWRNIAYSTFCVARIYDTGQVTIAECDSPSIIYIKEKDKPQLISGTECQIGEKTIRESYFRMEPGDMLLFFTDGIVYAGVGESLAMGWQEEGILEYVTQIASHCNGDCECLAEAVTKQALDYWHGNPGDDGTVVCIKYRKAKLATVITGPPADPANTPRMIEHFLAQEGIKIVSGGTTSHLVADYIGGEIRVDERFLDTDLPPPAKLAGVDLVTEGILTLNRATKYLEEGIPRDKNDAATALINLLLQADGITFIVGTARNPAHQNTGLPDSIFLRRRVVEDLAEQLQRYDKEVEIIYY
jgi:hypothetical protein